MICVVDHQILYPDKFVAVGDTVTIQCHGSKSTPILWQYQNSAELNARDLYDRDHLISARYKIDNTTYDLTISNVEVNDAGEYWCAENEGFGTKHVTELFVKGNVLCCFMVVKNVI